MIMKNIKRKIVILSAFLLLSQIGFSQKRNHISINGSPSGFLILSDPVYIGMSLLPELEYTHDFSSGNSSFFIGLQWTGVEDLTATTDIGGGTPTATKTTETNLAITAGVSFKLNTDDNAPITIPALDCFSLGIGYGNFNVDRVNGENIFKEGLVIIIGFKVKVLSFNIGK